jgi:hypothetical protein
VEIDLENKITKINKVNGKRIIELQTLFDFKPDTADELINNKIKKLLIFI